MGTSKSYISPKSKEWSSTKRAVTIAIKNPDDDRIIDVAKKFLTAVKGDSESFKKQNVYFGDEAFANIVGNILFLASCVKEGKTKTALSEFGIEHLSKENGTIILREFLHIIYEKYSALGLDTTKKAIKKAFSKLNITSIDDFKTVDIAVLIFEIFANFLFTIFMLNYDEHINNKTSINRGITIKEKIENGVITND